MADINTNSALSGLISQYGTEQAKAKTGVGNNTAGASTESADGLANQDVFMRLYIEQLKNQDPTKPQDSGDMVSQMAEFSSLERLTKMSDEMENLSNSLISSQALTASTLVGQYVYVEQDSAAVAEGNPTMLKTSFASDAVKNELQITNSAGQVVDKITLTDEEFQWDGTDGNGNMVPSGMYTFRATSTNAEGEITQLSVLTPARINGVTINGSEGSTLNVANYGKLPLSDKLDIVG
ncbi:Basal-body rod modification protein FlgD [Marinomonas aquimarina]|uniref:Basal-body rod modification protein FlgD n=1 Tax=Marinomonas aquimarina TaxID=295068 RepID=A0A1A8T2K0_9GAMM|nr:flagellar hook capping FlgD N-terminal domain-containing protein [Marinomonas aquimarina]SBS25556.1 Basal-body rod modification protein FlgD [Marinomonas aquimarina]